MNLQYDDDAVNLESLSRTRPALSFAEALRRLHEPNNSLPDLVIPNRQQWSAIMDFGGRMLIDHRVAYDIQANSAPSTPYVNSVAKHIPKVLLSTKSKRVTPPRGAARVRRSPRTPTSNRHRPSSPTAPATPLSSTLQPPVEARPKRQKFGVPSEEGKNVLTRQSFALLSPMFLTLRRK